MRCGFKWEAKPCIADHWLRVPSFKLEKSGDGPHWRGCCPGCGGELEVSDKGKTVAWNCHGRNPCDHAVLRPILWSLVLCQVTPKSGTAKRTVDTWERDAEMVSLILDPDIQPAALRVGLLQMLGMSTAEARAKLGLPRSTYYDALRILGQRRR